MLDSRATRAALAAAADAGQFFALEFDRRSADDTERWIGLRALIDDAAVLDARVATTRATLADRARADVETRAAASIDSLGFLSRVVSPALAAASLRGVVPVMSVDTLSWRPGSPIGIAIGDVRGVAAGSAHEAAGAFADNVLEPVVRPVVAAYRERFRLSPHTLWGNVASALAGAAAMLPAGGGIAAATVVDDLLDRAPLVGRGRYGTSGRFVRTNCCLFYRVPGGGVCGDCVLTSRATRRHDM